MMRSEMSCCGMVSVPSTFACAPVGLMQDDLRTPRRCWEHLSSATLALGAACHCTRVRMNCLQLVSIMGRPNSSKMAESQAQRWRAFHEHRHWFVR